MLNNFQISDMPTYCSVYNCKINYLNCEKLPWYGFPKDPTERETWRLALPNKFKMMKPTSVYTTQIEGSTMYIYIIRGSWLYSSL